MKAFICSMYKEFDNVVESIKEIRSKINDAWIFVAISDSGDEKGTSLVSSLCDRAIVMRDLSAQYNPWQLPSYCITRNFGIGFFDLYSLPTIPEYVVAFTGDTLITDASNFDRLHQKMKERGAVAAFSQAIGQDFHSDESDPEHGICGGRVQTEAVADFAPCLWMLQGQFAYEHKAFSDIKVTNKHSSEQCLGDELIRHLPDFKVKTMRLNEHHREFSYAYSDGVIYHHNHGVNK